jgi:hypothetical protein
MTTDRTPDPHRLPDPNDVTTWPFPPAPDDAHRRLLDEVSADLADARAALGAYAGPARSLLGAHVVAFQLLTLLRDVHDVTPNTVVLYANSDPDGDDDLPTIGFDFDATANVPWSRAEVEAAAAKLGLAETTEEGDVYFREWEGKVDGYDVSVTLFLPGAPRHRVRGFVLQHQGAVLTAIAAAGAVAGLGARRAILALVR